MRLEDAIKLHAMADAKYKARQHLLQTLLQRENTIRADLAKLDAQAKSAERTSDGSMRLIGADVMWKAWLGKTTRSLNMQLALILAEKDQHLRQVKQAYGKVLASEEILQGIRKQNQQHAAKVDLDAAINMSLAMSDTKRTMP